MRQRGGRGMGERDLALVQMPLSFMKTEKNNTWNEAGVMAT